MPSQAVYSKYSQDELDALYDTRRMVPDVDTYVARFEEKGQIVRAQHATALDLPYGPHPDERLDVFAPSASAGARPAHVFFHGGYWRSSNKERYSFVAGGFLDAGIITIVPEYALIPKVDMDELVQQCRRCIGYIAANASQLGVDPDRIFVSGHSAGGHIVGMLLADDGWHARQRLPRSVIKGGTGQSGLYELESIRHTYLNATLALDGGMVQRNSPADLAPTGAPLLIAVGDQEGPEFLRHSTLMDDRWRSLGVRTHLMVQSAANHYDMVDQLGDPAGHLTQEMIKQMTGKYELSCRDAEDPIRDPEQAC